MADVFDFYVRDNRKINFEIAEPIMREDSGVTDFRFHIPKTINGLDMSDWAWWFVFVNAKKEKYTIALELSDDPESPLENNLATYTVDYAMSIKAGAVQFALEAINAGTGGAIDSEWHTLTYETKVKETLQGNQAEYAETESDIISALLEEVRTKVNSLVGGATPLPVNLKSLMTDPQKVYLYTGTEQGEYTGNWYYHNGTQFVHGGVYGTGVVDAVPTQGSTNAVQSGGVKSALDGLQAQIPPIDPTLSKSGQAADAKATGDAITELKNDLNANTGTIQSDLYETTTNLLDFTFDKGLWKQGAPNANQGYTIYLNKKYDVSEGQVIYGATKATGIPRFRSVVFEYSSGDAFISRKQLAYGGMVGSYTVPSGVSYVYFGFTTNVVETPITPEQVMAFENVAYAGNESVTLTDFPARYIPLVDEIDKDIAYYNLYGIQVEIGGVHTVSDEDVIDFYDESVINYRVGTPNVNQYPYSITFTPIAGYRMYFDVKEVGATSYVGSGWKTGAYTIPSNAKWTLDVARIPEDTTIPAVLSDFLEAVTTSEKLATVKSKITNLEEQLSKAPAIDIYDVNSKYVDRTDALTQLTRLPMFLIFTDIHGFGQYLERIGDFHDANCASSSKDVICLGDIIYNQFSDSFAFMENSDFGKTVLLTIGNHDCYDGTTVGGVSATDLYNKFFAGVSLWDVVQPAGASANGYCYYYKDYDSKIRLVVLNEYYWDNAQKTWFENTLASAKSAGLAVIVAQHQGNYTEAEYEPLTDYAFGTKGYDFIRYTNGYTERRNTVDAFVSGGGEFIGWLSGHTHYEQFGTFTVNGRKQFTMTFSNAGQDGTSRAKIVNYSQDCFYYLAVDTTNKWVYVLTIGQATNKFFHRNLMLMYNYQTQEVIEYY